MKSKISSDAEPKPSSNDSPEQREKYTRKVVESPLNFLVRFNRHVSHYGIGSDKIKSQTQEN